MPWPCARWKSPGSSLRPVRPQVAPNRTATWSSGTAPDGVGGPGSVTGRVDREDLARWQPGKEDPERGDDVRLVRLGQTDLRASVIALGTWAFGGDWGPTDLEDSKATIRRALELGINLFDTAQGYVHSRARHRRAGLRATGPRPAVRPHERD